MYQRVGDWPDRARSYEWLISPMLVMAMAALAYLPSISELGFYRDDWYQLWAGVVHGPESIVTLFSIDRPFTGILYSLAYRAFGPSPMPWQLYSFGLRIMGALVFLWIVRWLWPHSRLMTTSMAILFVVYPGFLQQPNANTFSNQLTTYTTGLFSLALTAAAVTSTSRLRQVLLYGLSMLTALAYWLNYEYMIGLEGIRIVLIWIAVRRRGSPPRNVAAYWTPYLPILIGYLFWRGFIFESGRDATDFAKVASRFTGDPIRATLETALEGGKDLVETTFFAWGIPIYNFMISSGLREQLTAILLGTLASGLFIAYWSWLRHGGSKYDSTSVRKEQDSREAMVVGGLAIVFSVLPVILAGRDVHWHSGFDRYTLHVTAGVAMFLVGAIWYLMRPRTRPWLVAGLIAISLTTHYLNGLKWADHWRAQRDLWWQLSWRAPQLEDSTVLVAEIPTGGFFEDYEIWGPANLIYNAEPGPIRITAEILNHQTAEKIRFGSEDGRGMRELIEFHRDYDDVLILSYPSYGSCLHVIDGRKRDFPQAASGLVQSVARFSKIDRILSSAEPTTVPTTVFGQEPDHGWCYYYQQASLAAQAEDWNEVVRLGDEVSELGLRPSDRSEWMPFLEGYAKIGMGDKAEDIGVFIRDKEPIRHHICDNLSQNVYQDPEQLEILLASLCELD